MTAATGQLIAIGGHESKDGDRPILHRVAAAAGSRPLLIATLASRAPEEYVDAYEDAFAGITPVEPLSEEPDAARRQLDGAGGVFFSGGDQRRLLARLDDAGLREPIARLHERGDVIAGTSAGASVLGRRMLSGAPGDESYRIGEGELDDGLGLLPDLVVDQHFAQRGRIGRLLGAVAAHPDLLGVGIDEDTAIATDASGFEVIGTGAVSVLDARGISRSNLRTGRADEPLSIFGVQLHVLAPGDRFDLAERLPLPA